jgi:hypothetical protein
LEEINGVFGDEVVMYLTRPGGEEDPTIIRNGIVQDVEEKSNDSNETPKIDTVHLEV